LVGSGKRKTYRGLKVVSAKRRLSMHRKRRREKGDLRLCHGFGGEGHEMVAQRIRR